MIIVAVVVAALLLLASRSTTGSGSRAQFNVIITYAIAALGLNLLTGYNGQISIGHGAFFGVGAYTTAILVADHGWPHLATVAVAAVLAFVLGAARGLAGPAHQGPLPGPGHAGPGRARSR